MNPIVRAERLVAGGDALAREADGRIVFVRGALPGELVEIDVVREQRDVAYAVAVEVIEASPDRRVPPCLHRRRGCGGCGWMHLDPIAQLDAKVGIVTESLTRIGRLPADGVAAIVRRGESVPAERSRTTIRVVGGATGRPGFRVEASTDIVEVDSCLVAHRLLSASLSRRRVEPGEEVTLRISEATGETTEWRNEGEPGKAPTAAPGAILERIAGADLQVSATAFFQSGPAAAELLVRAVAAALPELASARQVVDAYGGVGLFAAALAVPSMKAGFVTVVESNRAACADAATNLAAAVDRRGDGAVRWRVERTEFGRWRPKRRPDVIIADPARPGLGKPGVAAVARSGTPVLALVSCDPVSLARDAVLLTNGGYHLESVEVFDLFPNTHHVETVSRFVRP